MLIERIKKEEKKYNLLDSLVVVDDTPYVLIDIPDTDYYLFMDIIDTKILSQEKIFSHTMTEIEIIKKLDVEYDEKLEIIPKGNVKIVF